MKRLIALLSLGLLFTGGFADSGSQHYKIKTDLKNNSESSTGCPYLDGMDKCPYKSEINKNYILKQRDIIKQIKKT